MESTGDRHERQVPNPCFGLSGDVFSGGTLEDVTDIFLLHADSPLSSDDWTDARIIHDIDADPRKGILCPWSSERNRHTYCIRRSGMTPRGRTGRIWYSHGEIDQETWTYRRAVGDEAALPELTVIEHEDMDILVSVGREGCPRTRN